jgi:hypothetical protein
LWGQDETDQQTVEGEAVRCERRASVEAGSGLWIQELERTLKREGIGYRILDVPPVLIYPPDRVPGSAIYPQSEEAAWVELKRFLEA